jgi:hypothetical protein
MHTRTQVSQAAAAVALLHGTKLKPSGAADPPLGKKASKKAAAAKKKGGGRKGAEPSVDDQEVRLRMCNMYYVYVWCVCACVCV